MNSENKILVTIRDVYGLKKVYPACSKADIFCKMLKQKTLALSDIAYIKELGFKVEVISDNPREL